MASGSYVDVSPRESKWVFGLRHHFLVGGAETGGALSMLRIEVPPGMGTPPHSHRNESETFYVLEGNFDVMQRGAIRRLGPGDSIHSPANTWHNFTSVGPDLGVLLVTITPAGFEEMFRELASDDPSMSQPRPPLPDEIEHFLRIAGKYGLELTEPGPVL